ncbi:MFS transporter [Bacteroides sp. 51]|uniref:MFS transporter n=1 Tax=Bacteroides sp. 51 TaxID=2302938 RepID=UPI0013D68126|nr:MFS transporter [Bacteroides sp. 51]NDV80373.1 MFS transporter [Bacteroides sp. 51]
MLVDKKNYPWIVVGLLWFVALLNYLDRQMLSTMRPFMMEDIAELMSAANFGRLMAIFLWIYAFMSPLSGAIADRLNRKWLIVISLFVWSGVTLAMGYARDMEQLYVLRALMGISEAFYIPAGLSLIADFHQGKTRSLAIGLHTSGIYLGQALGGYGATLADAFSWQFTFHTFGLVGMAYSLVLILFLREKKTYRVEQSGERSIRKELKTAVKGLSMLFSNIAFWVILFYFSAPSLPGWATKNWLPTLFSESLHMDMAQAGPLSTMVIAFASLVGVLVGGYVSDKWVQKHLKGRIYTGVIGLVITIPSLLLIGYGEGLVAIVSGALGFGLGFGIFDVNNMPILCQFVSSRYRATGYGLMNFAGISAGAIITNELGKAIDSGHTDLVFITMIAAVSLAICLQLTVLQPGTVDMKEE